MSRYKTNFDKIRTLDEYEYKHQTYNYLNEFETGKSNPYSLDDISEIFSYGTDFGKILITLSDNPIHLHDNRWYIFSQIYKHGKQYYIIYMGRTKDDVLRKFTDNKS